MNLYNRATGNGKTKTFCCDKKRSDQTVLGDDNRGWGCKPSNSGQCNIGYGTGQNYKFRCFNMNDKVDPDKLDPEHPDTKQNPDYDDTFRKYMREGKQAFSKTGETCSYVPGTLGRVVKTGVGVTKLGANILLPPLAFMSAANNSVNRSTYHGGAFRGRSRTQKKRKQSRKRKSGKRSSRKKPSA